MVVSTRRVNLSRGPSATTPVDDESGSQGSPLRRAVSYLLSGWRPQAAVSAVLLGVLLHLRYAYIAGARDHYVLSPLGMRWGRPDWFAGDWTVDNAPQPHWFFDVVTWLGTAVGRLDVVYFAYWLVALGVFGAATALLARAWVPAGSSWMAVLAVTACAAMTPLTFLGSGSTLFATALPNVLGGSLLYLAAAGLLLRRPGLAGAAGVATAVAHVQHGTVALVLLGMAAAVESLRARRTSWALVAATGSTLAVVALDLTLRPVAGHLGDFAEACQLIIPGHCEASTWTADEVSSGLGMVGLALLSLWYLPRGQRITGVVVLGMPALALLAGFAADRFDVPRLGLLAQGLNIYRLSLLLLPFVAWGLLVPVFARLGPVSRWVALVLALGFGYLTLRTIRWSLGPTWDGPATAWMQVFVVVMVVAVVLRGVPALAGRWSITGGVVAGGLVVSLLAGAVFGDILQLRRFDPRFFPYRDLTDWGAAVQQAVPPGERLMVPPAAVHLRMVTRRAVVVDCKYGPYGGPAWQEYKARIMALGGFGQCPGSPVLPRVPAYGALSAADLTVLARRYGADYLVVDSAQRTDQQTRAAGLIAAGWTPLVGPLGVATYELLRAPPGQG